VLGLVGTNGIGKSSALKILSGNLKPNLGDFDNPPDWTDIIKYFRGSELQAFFKRLVEEDLTSVVKIQYVDSVIKSDAAKKGTVAEKLKKADKLGLYDEVVKMLDLKSVLR